MEDQKQLEELIASAPFGDTEKKELLGLLNSEGPNQKFYDKFNTLLLDDLTQRAEKFKKATGALENKLSEADKELDRKRKKVEDQLAALLKDVSPDDLARSKQVWDEYYKAVETIEKEYENKLQPL